MAITKQQSDLKGRVITCLNKLSDRDTLSIASNELESIAKGLSDDSFGPFLTCLSTTDSSEKSPVRRQCVRLITVLSSAHGDALSPHLSKLLSTVLRRLRDPDTAVRSACVEAVTSISSHVTRPPFSLILKPLLDCIFHEQDQNAQIGASLCLAAAVEATPEPETTELKKQLPKLLKLVKNDCFKAKSALLSLIGSIVSVGGAASKNALNNLVPCVVDFLTSDDWAARKAAAETLTKLAVTERSLLADHKSLCQASLESRKFDKVKLVRETMQHALNVWKEVPEDAQCKSTTKETSSCEHPPTISSGSVFSTPETKKKLAITAKSPTSSSPSLPTGQKSSSKNDNGKPNVAKSLKMEMKQPSVRNIEVKELQSVSSKLVSEDGSSTRNIPNGDSVFSKNCFSLRSEAKVALFAKSSDDKPRKFNNIRLKSRVVPFSEDDNAKSDGFDKDNYSSEDYLGGQKEFEDFSLIRKQLVQIENQQCNLMELLQRFIGSSQHGMNSLEKRVKGLEKAIDEMSHDFSISTHRTSDPDAAGNACCMLAGAEFLSPKFWRKAEGQSNKIPFSNQNQLTNTMNNMQKKDSNSESKKSESSTNQLYLSHKSTIIDDYKEKKETVESHTDKRIRNKVQADKSLQACNTGGHVQPKISATGCVQLR